MPSLTGANIGGYSVLGPIGSGGMGTVYRAVHQKLGRTVAIKVLNALPNASRESGSFLQEARLQAAFRHPGIATLYDFLEFQNELCMVMEFVEGETLSDIISESGPLPLAQALSILRQLGEAVAYLHARNVVHRDIKASNIKVLADGGVKLLDFGIASRTGSSTLTSGGKVFGTFEYSAPEQLAGGTADQRSDIWSLGVLLYEMLTGRLPFEANDTAELCRRIQQDDFPRLLLRGRNASRAAEDLIGSCLKKRAPERFQTLDELQRAVNQASGRPNWAVLSHRPRLLALAACIVLVVALGVLLINLPSSQEAKSDTWKALAIDVMDGPAEVYQDGHDLGKTPVHIKEHWGEHISLVLKRAGYTDLPVDFDVDERSSYTYVLEPAAQQRVP